MEPVARHSLRQQEIIDTARKIISTKGIENLTIREIAKDIRLTEGALYRHFKSKREILSLLIDDISQTLLQAVERGVNSSDPPLEKLRTVFLSHLSSVEQRKGVSFIVINETLNLQNQSLQGKMLLVIRNYLERIEHILSEGIDRGVFKKRLDVMVASMVFFGMVQSAVTVWALGGSRDSLRSNKVKQMFEVYSAGIMAP